VGKHRRRRPLRRYAHGLAGAVWRALNRTLGRQS